MAYVPDNIGVKRRADRVSPTAFEEFLQYCQHADKETGLTFANPKTCAKAFGMRLDNAQKYDKELIDKGWIRLIEKNGRIYRKVEAGWLPKSQRVRQGKAENTAKDESLEFRETLDSLLNLSESSLNLGDSPKFKEILLNFSKAYKEVLNQQSNQQSNQQLNQIAEPAGGGAAHAKPKVIKQSREIATMLPADFSITEEMRSWASAKAPDVDIDDELEEFTCFWRDIALRNNKRTAKGWLATWQTRMRELQKRTAAAIRPQNGAINGTSVQRSNGYATAADRRSDAAISEYQRTEAIRARLAESDRGL